MASRSGAGMMAATDGFNKGSKTFKVTLKSGHTAIVMADSEFEARQKVAHRMTKNSDMSYGTAWRAVSPSEPKAAKFKEVK
jgi:hypothetical protein